MAKREAHQGNVVVERWQDIPGHDDLRRTGQSRQEILECMLHFEHDDASELGDGAYIATKLQGIAETLLAVHEDRPAAQRLRARPDGLRIGSSLVEESPVIDLPPPLVIGPAAFIIPGHQIRHRPIHPCERILGPARDRLVVARQGGRQQRHLLVDVAAIEERLGMFRIHLQGALAARERCLELTEFLEDGCPPDERREIIRLQRQRPLETRQGFAETP